MKIFSRENVLGLDIGFETLKLVELERNKKDVFLVGSIEIPLKDRILLKDKFKDKTGTANLIKEACRKAKPYPIKARRIVSALPETFVFSKTIQMPKMSEEEYKNAVPIEAAQYLPIPVEEVYIDYQILIVHPDEPLVDILVVASPKKLVDDYVEMTKIAGLELAALETKPIAVGRAVAASSVINGTIIAEIGTELTRISIWDNNSIRLISSVSTGKNQIIESMGLIQGATNDEPNADKADQNVCLAISNISNEIINAIKYHQNRDYNPKPITKLLLCGTGSAIPGVSEILSLQTKIEAEVVSPRLNGKDKLGTNFITAYGLALRNELE